MTSQKQLVKVKCRVTIKHQQTLGGKLPKYGLAVTRSGAPPSGGANVFYQQDDQTLFQILLAFGYSAQEITDVLEALAETGSSYTDERLIEESALAKHGF